MNSKTSWIGILVALAGPLPANAAAVARYPLDNHANDSIGSLDGTIHGAVGTQDRFGNADAALFFDGVDDWVGLPLDLTFDLPQGSISLWFKIGGVQSAQVILFGLLESDDDSAFKVALDQRVNSASQDVYSILRDSPTLFWQIQVPESAFDSRTNLAWNHLVVTQDNETAKLYLNGAAEGSLLGGDPASWWNVVFAQVETIGLALPNDDPTTDFYLGSIDDVTIFDHALSASEVGDIFRLIFQDGFESGDVSAWSSMSGRISSPMTSKDEAR